MSLERNVDGQAPRTAECNAFLTDDSLRFWTDHLLTTHDCSPAERDRANRWLSRIGEQVGSWRLQDAADRANDRAPALRTHDRTGRRIDEVSFDASWHELLDAITASGVCATSVIDEGAGFITRAAAYELWSRLDIGVMCPVTMTSAILAVLLKSDVELAATWAARIIAAANDPDREHPMAGVAMTEPQGGSDLSASSTTATVLDTNTWSLNGHKWFVSHPVADVLLVLARDPDAAHRDGSRGISCFLVQGWRADGERNGIELLRLKDKLGTHSLASAEVQLRDARAVRIGQPGAGVRTIIDMVVHTRMDCTIGSAGIMQRAITEAVAYARHRNAFGKPLADQPAMRLVLADLIVEREAALALAMEVATCFQQSSPLQRLTPAFAKFWVTRRAVAVCIECVEVAGGNGYVEEYPFARLYRDSQVNSTWEGSGNVMALDVIKAINHDPSLLTAYRDRIDQLIEGAAQDDTDPIMSLLDTLPNEPSQFAARRMATSLALVMQASLLVHRALVTGDERDATIARAFVSTRIRGRAEHPFGAEDDALRIASDYLLDNRQRVTDR